MQFPKQVRVNYKIFECATPFKRSGTPDRFRKSCKYFMVRERIGLSIRFFGWCVTFLNLICAIMKVSIPDFNLILQMRFLLVYANSKKLKKA